MLLHSLSFPFCKMRPFIPALPLFLDQQLPNSLPHLPSLPSHLGTPQPATGGVFLESRSDHHTAQPQSLCGLPLAGRRWFPSGYKAVC